MFGDNNIDESETLKLKQQSMVSDDDFAANDRSMMQSQVKPPPNMVNSGSFMANDRDDIETLRQKEQNQREYIPEQDYKDLSEKFEIQLPEYKGIQNLTGINKVQKGSSFEKSDDLYRFNSLADAQEDN